MRPPRFSPPQACVQNRNHVLVTKRLPELLVAKIKEAMVLKMYYQPRYVAASSFVFYLKHFISLITYNQSTPHGYTLHDAPLASSDSLDNLGSGTYEESIEVPRAWQGA